MKSENEIVIAKNIFLVRCDIFFFQNTGKYISGKYFIINTVSFVKLFIG